MITPKIVMIALAIRKVGIKAVRIAPAAAKGKSRLEMRGAAQRLAGAATCAVRAVADLLVEILGLAASVVVRDSALDWPRSAVVRHRTPLASSFNVWSGRLTRCCAS